MKEDNHRDKVRPDGLLEISYVAWPPIFFLFFFDDGRPVDPAKEVSSTINDDIEGKNTIDWVGISRNLSIKKLSQVTVKGAIRTSKQIVSQLEIGY